MKDESRELIEQYKDMYQKLNEQSIFSLRTYGREIGVAQPTLKKKEELIIHIIKIMNGLEAPAKQSNKGAHPKSQKVVWEKEDKSIKPVADDEGDKMVDLKITQNELVTLAELVYLGSIVMEGSEKEETILRSNELCNKIFCKYYQIIKGNELKENISENDIAAVHDRLFDRVGWLIDKYEWDSTVDRISQIYANKEVQIKNYDVQQYALNKEAENRCRELLKKGGAASITVVIENNNSIVLHLKA